MEKIADVIAVEARASSTDCDWTELPADLLVRIFGTMKIPDLFSCGGVCRSWRRGHLEARRFWLCSPQESPCLVYSAADRDDGMATLHHLSTDRLYHVALPEPAFRSRYVMGSAHGWLITADERSNLILVNPVTGAQVVMPPPETMSNVELRYDEDGNLNGYEILYVDTVPHDVPESNRYGVSLEQGRFCFYITVAMSFDPSNTGNCIVVRIHIPNDLLSYARVGDINWTWVDAHEECKDYVDVCYNSRDGLFYALQGCGDVHTIDLHGPSARVNIVYIHEGNYRTDSKYIAQAPWGDCFQIWRWDRYLEDEEVVQEEDDEDNDVDETMEEIVESLKLILTIFAKLNLGIRYVQGMNEVLAPLYYVFKNDPDQSDAGCSLSIREDLLNNYAEHTLNYCTAASQNPA
ncbi:F-box only protein 7-like [Lolium perenne]|uniref:F-box only protein 7-like n=1 Tax=Lolium perenne TaxID=4522 RepID=UPI003A99B825